MADDNNPRFPRGGDPFARGNRAATPGGHGGASDPLAELARLIGQNDPFADFGREPPRSAQATESQHWPGEDQVDDWRSPAPDTGADRYADERGYAQPEQGEDRYADERAYRQPDYGDERYVAPVSSGYARQGDDDYADTGRDRYYADSEQAPADPYGAERDARYSDRDPYALSAEQLPPPVPGLQSYSSAHGDDLRIDDDRYADSAGAHRYDDRGTTYREAEAAAPAYGSDPYGRDDLQPLPPLTSYPAADNFDDEGPAPRKRGGLVVVMAVLALAVLGTAGAFGYRVMFGTSNASTSPPVIKADATPSKVTPATPANEPQNKISYDRVGERAQGEKVVLREEQPVDMKDSPAPGTSRSVFPNPTGATPPPLVPSQSSPSALPTSPALPPPAAQAGSPANEPKKVRTVIIRPDKSGGFATVPTVPRPSSAAAANNSASPFPDPPAPGRSAAPRTASSATAPAAPASEPLALAPRNAPATDVVPRPRVAAAPARAAAQPTAPGGSYSVQVSSQRSEADAQASYRALQAKFPTQLGTRDAFIRRADLGDKGIFFRALVGPFTTSEQAAELCSSLKAAGGQCLIQRN
jgi:hypothetical protein